MSTPTSNQNGNPQSAMMYAPPWARDGAREQPREPSRGEIREADVRQVACAALEEALRDAPAAAAENALAASEQLRRTLPPASQLGERRARWREPAPFEGDIAIVRLRERPTLEPVVLPVPPAVRSGSATSVLTRVVGAVGLAALAAFFMVGTTPFSFAVKAEGETAPSLWSRLITRSSRPQPAAAARKAVMETASPAAAVAPRAPALAPTALAERFAAVAPAVEAPPRIAARPVQTIAVPAAPPAPVRTEPAKIRALDAEEIATLYRRSEELVAQGDIAGARLLLTRAAEAGDARSALALGATYDPAVLGKLGVLGVKPNPEKARAWYAKAADFGSGEATRRLEVLAQGR